MTVTEIDAFLAVVRYGNMAEAARRLYTSQPTLSRRIHMLEEELGYPLLIRNKGIRKVELTFQGEKFIQVVENWKQLWNDMQKISTDGENYTLHFSSINSLISYIIYPSVLTFLEQHPNVHIILESQHSYTAYTRVREGILDSAFVCNTIYNRSIQATPLWCEPMYLVAGPMVKIDPDMSPSDLDSRYEIRVPWNNEFDEWHDYWFGMKEPPRLIIDQMPAVEQLLSKNPAMWMVAPVSAAQRIAVSSGARLLSIDSLPERRVFYISKNGYSSDIMDGFLRHLIDTVSLIKEISITLKVPQLSGGRRYM